MSITCQICNTEYEKIIPWQHLRTHDISTKDYKEKFGELYSIETLDRLSKRIPHNKGKKVTDCKKLDKHKIAMKKREERYHSAELNRTSGKFNRTPAMRQLASTIQTAYAINNHSKMKDRSQKAIQTKIGNNYDFGASMRGKTQSVLSKVASRQNAYKVNAARRDKSNVEILEKLKLIKLTLLNDINSVELSLLCQLCGHQFTFTKQYFYPSKFKETICPQCFPRTVNKSKGKLEIFEFVKSMSSDAISGNKENNKYHSKEIDIFIPSLNIGFEYTGLYYHSQELLNHNNRSEKSDYIKQQEFFKKGICIIPIFSDEWETKQDIVKSRISNILKKTSNVVYARKCEIKEISSQDASVFCETNHIMGRGRSNVRFGLYYNNELMSVMTFSKNNLSRKIKQWKINRFASKLNTAVVGGASRLFKKFINDVNPSTVLSYADNRWPTGNLYKQLGFTKSSNGLPNYWYFKPGTNRIHRFNLRKTKADVKTLTEYENRLAQGYLRIWDCGSSKWEWHKSTTVSLKNIQFPCRNPDEA